MDSSTGDTQVPDQQTSRSTTWIAVVAVVVIVALGFGGFAYMRHLEQQRATTEAERTGPVETPTAEVPSPTDEPAAETSPEPNPSASIEPSPEPDESPDGGTLDLAATFDSMLAAMAEHGEDGLLPFLKDPSDGDLWGISDHDWSDPQCSENVDEPSGCTARFEKDGASLENVFMFELVDDVWLLTESYVWE